MSNKMLWKRYTLKDLWNFVAVYSQMRRVFPLYEINFNDNAKTSITQGRFCHCIFYCSYRLLISWPKYMFNINAQYKSQPDGIGLQYYNIGFAFLIWRSYLPIVSLVICNQHRGTSKLIVYHI